MWVFSGKSVLAQRMRCRSEWGYPSVATRTGRVEGMRSLFPFCRAGVTLLLLLMLFVPFTLSAQMQGSDLPTLDDGKTSCTGLKKYRIIRAKGETRPMWLKIVVWHKSSTSPGIPSAFSLQREVNKGTGTALEDLAPGDGALGIKGKICVTEDPAKTSSNYKPIPGHDGWYEIVVSDEGKIPQDATYVLSNKLNVFNVGVAYGSLQPTNFSWQSGAATFEPKVSFEVVRASGTVVSVTDLSKPLVVCKGSDLQLRAKVKATGVEAEKIMDDFPYEWSAGNMQNPPDGRQSSYKNVVSDASITVRVSKGKYVCELDATATVNVQAIDPLRPVLDPSDQVLCPAGTDNKASQTFKVSGVTTSELDKIKWEWVTINQVGTPPETITSVAVPNDLTTEVNRDLIWSDQGGQGNVREYRMEVSVHKGECVGKAVSNIKIAPHIPKPVISFLKPTNPTLPAEFCSPYSMQFKAGNLQSPDKMALSWTFGTAERQNTAEPLFEGSVSTTEKRNIVLEVSTKDGYCKQTSDPVEVTLHPAVTAKMKMSVDPPSHCAPLDFYLESAISDPAASYTWEYLYTKQDGTEGVETLGTGDKLEQKGWMPPEDGREKKLPIPRIRLTVQTGSCTSTDVSPIEVLYQPSASNDLRPANLPGCVPITSQFTLSDIKYASKYYWMEYPDDAQNPGKPDFTKGLGIGRQRLVGTQTSLTENVPLDNDTDVDQVKHIALHLVSDEGCELVTSLPVDIPAKLEPLVLADFAQACPGNDGKRKVKLTNKTIAGSPLDIEDWSLDGSPAQVTPSATNPKELTLELENGDTKQSKSQTLLYKVERKNCAKEFTLPLVTFPKVDVTLKSIEYHDVNATGTPTWTPWTGPICPAVRAKFSAEGAAKYKWEISGYNGTTLQSNLQDYEVNLDNRTANKFQLVAKLYGYNDQGCAGNVEQTVELQPGYAPKVSSEILSKCNPVKIRLKDETATAITGGVNKNWELDGGVPDPTDPDVYVYDQPGDKSVVLAVSVANNVCGELKSEPIKFTVPDKVIAKIASINPVAVCAPALVTFDPAGSTPDGKDPNKRMKFTWFVEGEAAGKPSVFKETAESVTYTYSNQTDSKLEHEVVLVVEDALGCQSRATKKLEIFPSPKPICDVVVVPESKCKAFEVEAKVASTFTLEDCKWTFQPVPAQASSGDVVTKEGKVSASPWKATLTNKEANTVVQYNVFFEGSKQWTPTVTCSYKSTDPIKVIDVHPALKLDVKFITPNSDPSLLELCSGEQITFENKSSGGAIRLDWNFDDGNVETTSGSAPAAPHTFVNEGTADRLCKVSIVARQEETGCVAKMSTDVRVHPKVVALFKTEQLKAEDICKYPYPLQLVNLSRFDQSSSDVTTKFLWNYGYAWNGKPQTKELLNSNPHEHLFYNADKTNDANYTISLEVNQTYASKKVCRASTTGTVVVPPELVPAFNIDRDKGCIPHTVVLQPKSMGGTDLKYKWTFGDGAGASTEGNATTVTHEYKDLGNTKERAYPITLVAENKRGCTKEVKQDVTTYPKVFANFSIDKSQYCSGESAVVTNQSVNAGRYTWALDEGGTISNIPDASPLNVPLTNAGAAIQNYKLTLLAEKIYSGITCSDKVSKEFVVYPQILADFQISPLEGCSPITLTASDMSNGLVKPKWYVDGELRADGDPSPSWELANPSNTTDRVVEVKLVETNAIGCTEQVTKQITIFPHVDATFRVEGLLAGCTPFTTEAFTVNPSPAYAYNWSISGGTIGSPTAANTGKINFVNDSQPPATINGQLKLDVSLKAHADCKASMAKSVSIFPKVYPDFEGLTESCSPFKSRFTNKTQVEDDASAVFTWTWNNVSSNQREDDIYYTNPSHTDNAVFDLCLEAQSKDLCKASTCKQITVFPRPKPYFTIAGSSEACPPFDLTLTNASEASTATYELNWGDGAPAEALTSATAKSTHKFENTTTEKQGYVVSLKATTDHSCEDTYSQTISVYPGVKADFAFDPGNESCSPFLVTFKNSSFGGTVYHWDFGDGKTAATDISDFGHLFENLTESDVVYNVKLNVETEYGCKDEKILPLTVWATPKAKIDVIPPLQYYPNATVTMGNTSNPAADGWKYQWNFGDGNTSTNKHPGEHTYTSWAPKDWNYAFPVELVINSEKCSDKATQNVFILPPPPDTRFSSDYYEACAPMVVFFTNETEYATEYLWDFGDGNTSTEREPVHTYEQPGTYHVKLTAKGEGGEFPGFRIYTAHGKPQAQFSVHPERIMMPHAMVKVSDESLSEEPIEKYEWNFGDGFLTTEESPVHQYGSAGEYKVALKITTVAGCWDDTILDKPVVVMPEGKLVFPTAFSPNIDGPNGGAFDLYDTRNEVFHPYLNFDEIIDSYHLIIFNRWGETLFESHDIHKGWDGYRDGKLCTTGVYAWRVTGRFYNGEVFDMRGNVTLLR